MKITFTNLNPKVIVHASKRQNFTICALADIRIPENAPDLELAWLTLDHSVLNNLMSMLSPVLNALYGESHW